MSIVKSLSEIPPRLIAGLVNALNPLRIIGVGLLYFAAVIAFITLALMLPGLLFGLLPELMDANFGWAKDAAAMVTDNILPIWFAFILLIAVCADIVLDFFILAANIIGGLFLPPTYIGMFRTGGWTDIPFNPLTTLINQLYQFFKTVAE